VNVNVIVNEWMNCDCQQNTLCSRGGHKLLQEETLR
jgi:hypothetical protein